MSAALLVAVIWSAHGCGDSATINPEVELASLTVSSTSGQATLQPVFNGGTTNYSVNLSSNVESVIMTAQPAVSGDSVTIDVEGDQQATTRRVVALKPAGTTTSVSVIVSESTSKSRTYVVSLNRAGLAGNNSLQNLSVSAGALAPAFSQDTLSYDVSVETTVNEVTVTATKSDPNAVISGDVPNNGQSLIPLGGPGTTKDVLITVTAQNGIAKTYRITIKRAAPMDNNNLSALTINAGSLSPPFSSGIINYSADVPATADRITLSATKSDPNAEMSSLGSVIAAVGVPSGEVTATVGLGTTVSILIDVRAPDRSLKTYTVTVFRLPR